MSRGFFDEYDPLKGKRLQVLSPDGSVQEHMVPPLDAGTLAKAYRTMVLARAADDRAFKLQRQGRLGAYAPTRGQEASQLGPVLALEEPDWMVPAFRELTGLLWRGVPLWRFYLYWMGNEQGSLYPENVRVTPVAVPVASQIPHAVGISYASMLREERAVTMVFFGDGATSEGDFHEALNFAGVFKTPIVFVCQNNQYAISTPRSHQTASETIAQKALAYGLPGIQVDGNDLLALYAAAKEALDRARRGEGGSLIEAFTYRLGDHTTSDDATRYRQNKELEEWERKDPLRRLRTYLEKKRIWDGSLDDQAWAEAGRATDEAVAKAESHPSPSVEEIFQFTYQDMTPWLLEQMENLKREPRPGGRR